MPDERGVSEQLQALLRAATNHTILLTDLSGALTMFNEGAERLLGYRAVDVVGKHTPDLFFAPGELADAAAEFNVAQRYTAVVAAARKLNVTLPIILRLEGTNVEEGRKIIADSGLKVQIGATMKEAADLAVAAAKGVN